MPFAYAFKKAALAGSKWSKFIAEATHGPYSHVECWVQGPQNAAVCYSSREGTGVARATIDLTDPMWVIWPVPTTPEEDMQILWFCKGSEGKAYDYLALLVAAGGRGVHKSWARICSEFCLEVGQNVLGLLPSEDCWAVSPNRLATILNNVPS